MAYTAILQDWITVQGTGTATTGAIPPETDYLNVTGVQDMVIYVLFSQITGTGLVLNFDTAPLKEEALFLPILSTAITPAAATAPNVSIVKYTSGTAANPPLAAWLRWHLSGGSTAWSVTMRISSLSLGNPNTVGFSGSGGIASGGVLAAISGGRPPRTISSMG